MSKLAYLSISKFIRLMIQAFRESLPEENSDDHRFSNTEEQEMATRARFQVSINDLKIISSALLHYKKFLNKRKDFEKAEVVAEVDDRIYKLILGLDKQKETALEEGAFAS